MNTKVNEGKLISGKDALIALANDRDVEYLDENLNEWVCMDMAHHFKRKFRLKPKTILINGIEAPSIKKESAIYRSNDTVAIVCESFEEAELMCLALRQVFGGSHDN